VIKENGFAGYGNSRQSRREIMGLSANNDPSEIGTVAGVSSGSYFLGLRQPCLEWTRFPVQVL